MIERYSRPEMVSLWSESERYRLWLEIETLVLEAMVRAGTAPASALVDVRNKGGFSVARINELEATLKHDVIAFLTSVAETVGASARYLHLGLTSSDLIDTAFSVQLCRASDLILVGISNLMEVLKRRAFETKDILAIGRSHGVHAEPIAFGLKFASFYAELRRQYGRLQAARSEMAVGTFSGPVGTFAHLGPDIEAYVCERLGLVPDSIATQVISRDRHAVLFSTFAHIGQTLERMAVEVRHLQRTEVGEVQEFFSRGQKGSSAMPHKQNPVLSENITGLARMLRAWAQAAGENVALWHERDISHSSVERIIAPDMAITLDFMLERARRLFDELIIHPERITANLELTRGLVYSGTLLVELAKKGLSREEAYGLVQGHALLTWDELKKTGASSFRQRIEADKAIRDYFSSEELDEIFSPRRHLAHVDLLFSRVFI